MFIQRKRCYLNHIAHQAVICQAEHGNQSRQAVNIETHVYRVEGTPGFLQPAT